MRKSLVSVYCLAIVICLTAPGSLCLALTWHTDLNTALAAAQLSGKNVLMMAGRDACGNCSYMKKTVFTAVDPPIQDLVSANFEPVFLDVDETDDWRTYAAGVPGFSLPMICAILPSDSGTYADRTFGVYAPDQYYDHLLLVVNSLMPAAAPSAPAVSAATDGNLAAAAWTAVQGADGYVFYFAPFPSGTPIYSLDMGGVLEISAQLWPGAAYYVAVKAYNAAGQSPFSNITYFAIAP